jgi:hypothetical protein
MVVGAIDADHAAVVSQGHGIVLVDPTGAFAAASAPALGLDPGTYVGFTNADHGFALGTGGPLLRTVDGGRTWTEVAIR